MQRRGLTLASPAKINLFLRVMNRRPDGYHNLCSLFQAIDLVDILHFSLSDSNLFTINSDVIPADHNNLVVKAVETFRAATGLRTPVNIHLDKRIPVQAGLGGGSSNAATTLWALNELHGRPATIQQLMRWGGKIGSDVAFFLSEGTAYCTGRGEIITPMSPLAPQSFWILKPKEGLSTPEVYKKLAIDLLPDRNPKASLKAWVGGKRVLYNDLEQAAFAVMPMLAALKTKLFSYGFTDIIMSGSGSALACFGDGDLPLIPGVDLFPVKFTNRAADGWYA